MSIDPNYYYHPLASDANVDLYRSKHDEFSTSDVISIEAEALATGLPWCADCVEWHNPTPFCEI
jgi:hypothetical protein